MIPTFNKTRSLFSTVGEGRVKNAQDKLAGAASQESVLQGGVKARTDSGDIVNKAANKVEETGKNFNLTKGLGSTATATKSEVITSGATPVVVPTQTAPVDKNVNKIQTDISGNEQIAENLSKQSSDLNKQYNDLGVSDSEIISKGYDEGNKSIDTQLKSGNAQGNMSTGATDIEAEEMANLAAQQYKMASNAGMLGNYFKNYSGDAYTQALDSNILQQQFNDAQGNAVKGLREKAVAQANLERQLGGLDKTGKDSKVLLSKEKAAAEDLSKKNLNTIKSSADMLMNMSKDAIIKAGDSKKELGLKTDKALAEADEIGRKDLSQFGYKNILNEPAINELIKSDLSIYSKYKALTSVGYDDNKAKQIIKDKYDIVFSPEETFSKIRKFEEYTPDDVLYAKKNLGLNDAKNIDEKLKIMEDVQNLNKQSTGKKEGGDYKGSDLFFGKFRRKYFG